MNCEQSEREILFLQSGEAPAQALQELEEHLGRCEHCRKYRNDFDRIVAAAREALPAGEPGDAAMARIRTAAEKKTARGQMIIFPQPMTRVIAYAAALTLFIGGWLILSSDTRSQRINDINTIMAMVSENGPEEMEYPNGSDDEQKLRTLARQLLHMEGLTGDDLTDMEFISPHEKPTPTALRSRSIGGLDPKRCV